LRRWVSWAVTAAVFAGCGNSGHAVRPQKEDGRPPPAAAPLYPPPPPRSDPPAGLDREIGALPGARAVWFSDSVYGKVYVVLAGPERTDVAPVVLVHGLGTNGVRDWYPVLTQLSTVRRVVLFDLPGDSALQDLAADEKYLYVASSGSGQGAVWKLDRTGQIVWKRPVPDLIAVLDAESAEPLTAEMLSYGQRVSVIGYSAAPIMRRAESLAVFGPRMFGIDEDAVYRDGAITLEPGDVLVMYTDGVTEALDAREELFSEDRLQTELAASGLRDARDLAGRVLARVAAFAGDTPQADDIAMLVLRRGPAGLRLASRLSELPQLAAEVARLGREHDLPAEVVSDLTLALEEAVSNVIRHGYGERPDGPISVAFCATGESIVVTVEDAAVGFDPLKHPEPDLTVPVDARPAGGMGVYLIKRLMDEVDYRVDDGRNVLMLTKRIRRATCH
jgi:anti-sigma regulatory factor (Ser/Thr protein kinase)